MPTQYAAVFAELKDALRPFRREVLQPTAGETSRLREAVGEARELVEKDRLRTRAQTAEHGALRRGAQYLEERDLASLTTAEELLRGL
ncbi:MAG TPA: hypothetical protein VEX86_03220 [Longimicrobium sp.]|nr:hypothetical protein [Longimicrobium sp.]